MESLKAFKLGDSFDLTYSLPIDFGSTLSAIYSTICDKDGTPIQSLTVEALSDDGTFSYWRISAEPSETESWVILTPNQNAILYCDIKHETTDGNIIHSDTFTVPVIKAQTP